MKYLYGQNSLQKNGMFHVLRFSAMYSILIALGLILLSFLGLRFEKENQLLDKISNYLNSYEASLLGNNLPTLVEKLQQKTNLQEILLYDENCNFLGGSVLVSKNICFERQSFKELEFELGSSRLKLYYNFNFLLQDFLLTNATKFLYWLAGIFLITAIVLNTFLFYTVLKPIREMSKTFQDSFSPMIPEELNFFQKKIITLKSEILKSEKEKAYLQASRKVIHDIRNPLLYVRNLVEEGSFPPNEFIEKLNDIDFQINSILGREQNSIHELSLQIFFENLKSDCEKMFRLNISIRDPGRCSVILNFNPSHLKNILLNFFRNSNEAMATEIRIEWAVVSGNFELHIKDNGVGVEESIKTSLFTKELTTKPKGNGIGLHSAREKLVSSGGDIVFLDSECGAYFVLKIPIFKVTAEIALIDDDKFIHASWKSKSQGRCVVHSFYSVDEFLNSNLSRELFVFIDSDLGNDVYGEWESKKIFSLGYKQIYLTTNYADIEVSEFPWIRSLIPKSGPFSTT